MLDITRFIQPVPRAQKIKIAYLIDHIDSDLGGTEKQLLEIIRRLDRGSFEPYLICLKETEWIRNASLPCPHSVLDFEGFLKMSICRSLWRFRRLLREERFDIIQTFFEDSIFFCFLGTLLGPRPRVLLSSRRDIGLVNQPWYHKLYKLLLPFINLRFDGIVANGQSIKQHVIAQEKISAGKIKVIPNGVEMPRLEETFVPAVFEKHRPALWIGIAANFNRVKRIDVFLNALSLLRERHGVLDFRAVHLGGGPERESMTVLRRELGLDEYVIFEGAVKNVGAYLRRLDIAILCSDREGLSNAILEYMGHSLPVVVTAVGGNIELVDETNGFCVPPDNPEALAEALKTLAMDSEKRKSMGRVSRQKVEGIYSWTNSMQEWEHFYKGLLYR